MRKELLINALSIAINELEYNSEFDTAQNMRDLLVELEEENN